MLCGSVLSGLDVVATGVGALTSDTASVTEAGEGVSPVVAGADDGTVAPIIT